MRDMTTYGKVGVLLGGTSTEREVSLVSGQRVLAGLRDLGIDAHPFDPAEHNLIELSAERFDRVVISLHGGSGEDGTIQGILNWMGIPYTGSGVMASALALDKWRTKLLWRAAGIPTPDWVVLTQDSSPNEVVARLGLPIFVKPACEGSSLGMTRVTDAQQLMAAWEKAAALDDLVLAEQCIDAGEYTCAILGDTVLPMIRLLPAGEYYDYAAKYERDDTEYRVPCGLSAAQEEAIGQQALQAFRVLGCRGWGRLDVMLDADENPWFLEANTSPGMTSHSLVPMAAKAAGMTFEQLLLVLLETACVG